VRTTSDLVAASIASIDQRTGTGAQPLLTI
jgi:hypothetical protein